MHMFAASPLASRNRPGPNETRGLETTCPPPTREGVTCPQTSRRSWRIGKGAGATQGIAPRREIRDMCGKLRKLGLNFIRRERTHWLARADGEHEREKGNKCEHTVGPYQ